MNIKDLDLNLTLEDNLIDLEFEDLTTIQENSFPIILNKKNLIAISYTGSGKTAAYLIPTIQNLLSNEIKKNQIQVIILVPTRELCLQINDFLKEVLKDINLDFSYIFGSTKDNEMNFDFKKNSPNILITTPVKLKDLIEEKIITLTNLKTFVLDEADLIIEQNTQNSLKGILKKIPLKTQKLLFSATFNSSIEEIAKVFIGEYEKQEIDDDLFDLNLIEQKVFFVDEQNKDKLLLQLLDKKEVKSGIIFTNTKQSADNLVRFLVENKIKVEALHSAKSNFHRIKVINNLKTRKNKFLVATDLGSRGLDITNLTHIINYEIPNNTQSYTHRIGRVGRAGNKGEVFNLVTGKSRDDFKKQEQKNKIKLITHEFHSNIVFENKKEDKKSRKKVKSNFKGKNPQKTISKHPKKAKR